MASENNPVMQQADFDGILRSAAPAAFAERWGRSALRWGGALAILALLALAALWLRNERSIDQSMAVVASGAQAPAPPLQGVSTLPPLVMLETAPVAPARASPPIARSRAPAHKAATAQKRATRPVNKVARMAPSAGATPETLAAVRSPISDVAQYCKPGDLARDCLAKICRDGKRSGSACDSVAQLVD
jgi:hypothetical protein